MVAENIARQLENRISFRRAQKQAIQRTMRAGAKGIKTQSYLDVLVEQILLVLNITAKEQFHFTRFVLISIMVHAEADTTYGKIGVKVWIYRGEVLPTKKKN